MFVFFILIYRRALLVTVLCVSYLWHTFFKLVSRFFSYCPWSTEFLNLMWWYLSFFYFSFWIYVQKSLPCWRPKTNSYFPSINNSLLLLLLLSRFSRVRLLVTPWTAAHQGPPSMGFSSGHVWMWELGCEEGWAPENWCFWTMVLEKTLENPLDRKSVM